MCDVFCMPSYFEAYGLVFVEALTFGLPCIGRNCYEMPYFIEEGKTGLLRKRIGIHVLLQKKLIKRGGFPSFVSLLWKVANGLAIGFYNSPMVHWVAIGQSCQGCR